MVRRTAFCVSIINLSITFAFFSILDTGSSIASQHVVLHNAMMKRRSFVGIYMDVLHWPAGRACAGARAHKWQELFYLGLGAFFTPQVLQKSNFDRLTLVWSKCGPQTLSF